MSKVSIFLISKGKAFQSLIDLRNRPCVQKFSLIHSRIVKPLKSGIKEKATSLNSKNMPHVLLLVYRLGPRKGGYNLPKGREVEKRYSYHGKNKSIVIICMFANKIYSSWSTYSKRRTSLELFLEKFFGHMKNVLCSSRRHFSKRLTEQLHHISPHQPLCM